MVIRATDRVAKVLERDERLIEVFASLSPTFERLRNPGMRKVMARLVTVSAAAHMAGIDEQLLVDRLNEALGEGTPDEPEAGPSMIESSDPASEAPSEPSTPPWLASITADDIIDVDVREDLRQGREPFSRIMAARASVLPGQVLRLRAIFEPVPLYYVLGKQGFEHWTQKLADDDWQVWFYRSAQPDRQDPRPASATDDGKTEGHPGEQGSAPDGSTDDDVVVLDVRGLDPPEPMVRTLAALETLPAGATLVQINVRVPQFLLPRLEEAGFDYEIREQPDVVRVFIRRRPDG